MTPATTLVAAARRHMSQGTLAKGIGVTRECVRKWETGRSRPGPAHAAALAAVAAAAEARALACSPEGRAAFLRGHADACRAVLRSQMGKATPAEGLLAAQVRRHGFPEVR